MLAELYYAIYQTPEDSAMRDATLVVCSKCGKHGNILFAGGEVAPTIASQELGRAVIAAMIEDGDISKETGEILLSQLKISSIPEPMGIADLEWLQIDIAKGLIVLELVESFETIMAEMQTPLRTRSAHLN